MQPKYNILQRMKNATVVSIYTAEMYAMLYPNSDYTNWDRADPRWREKFIYTLKYDEPMKPVSIEDLQNTMPDATYKDLENIYKAYPTYQYIAVPEEVLNKSLNEHILS